MAHPVDLLVDGRFFFDKGIGTRHIGFGLVVIVIGDKILNRIVGEEAFEFAIKLGGQCLVGRENKRGALRLLDHLRHGEGFAGTGDAEQHLIAVKLGNAFNKRFDRSGLIARRLIFRYDLEAIAAFGLFRAKRAMRCPFNLVAKARIAAFEEFFKRGERSAGAGDGFVVLLFLVLFHIALPDAARRFLQHGIAGNVLVADTIAPTRAFRRGFGNL